MQREICENMSLPSGSALKNKPGTVIPGSLRSRVSSETRKRGKHRNDQMVYSSAQARITKYHKIGGLTKRIYLLTVLEVRDLISLALNLTYMTLT